MPLATPSPADAALFLAVVAAVLLATRVLLRMPPTLWIAVLVWQALMGVLAWSGYFQRFDQPWRAMPTVAVGIAAAAWLATRPFASAGRWLTLAPPTAWVAIQVFRLPLELLLYGLFTGGVIGRQMTFVGANFDIAVGLSAPLLAGVLAWLGRRGRHARGLRRIVLAWNLAGLALLLNIVAIAVLSIPFPFQLFTQEPANRFIATLPFVWLPTLLVPLALMAHFVSLRRAWPHPPT